MTVGSVASTRNASDFVSSSFPARSVEWNSSVWSPSAETGNGDE